MDSVSSPRLSIILRIIYRLLFLSPFFIIFTSVIVQAEIYKVIRVYDGDPITILDVGQKQSTRLVGADTPEKFTKKGEPGQLYSQKSTKFLAGVGIGQRGVHQGIWQRSLWSWLGCGLCRAD